MKFFIFHFNYHIICLDQYRVKSEPDEKVAKGGQGIFTNIEAVKEYSNELIELIKSRKNFKAFYFYKNIVFRKI